MVLPKGRHEGYIGHLDTRLIGKKEIFNESMSINIITPLFDYVDKTDFNLIVGDEENKRQTNHLKRNRGMKL